VVEFNAICAILPEDIRGIFEEKQENDLSKVTSIVSKSTWFSRFRLIPFSSLGRENGILIGFKPDFILIGSDETQRNVCEVVIGIYNRSLSRNDKYKALLSPELVA
jgi:stage II sporulation protein GA (sporulation sigma-E factor processing peptidase)